MPFYYLILYIPRTQIILNKFTFACVSIYLLLRDYLPATYMLPTYCLPTTYILPTAYLLPTYYLHATHLLPTCYPPTTYMLPTYYLHATHLLPTCYLPTYHLHATYLLTRLLRQHLQGVDVGSSFSKRWSRNAKINKSHFVKSLENVQPGKSKSRPFYIKTKKYLAA